MNEMKKAYVKDMASDAVMMAGGIGLIYAGTVASELVPVPVRMGIELLGATSFGVGIHDVIMKTSGKLMKVSVMMAKND